ncbi:hypothetical protein [Algoriphagus boritolerans]
MFLNLWLQGLIVLGGVMAIFVISYLGYIIGPGLFFLAWRRWQTAKKEVADFKQSIRELPFD